MIDELIEAIEKYMYCNKEDTIKFLNELDALIFKDPNKLHNQLKDKTKEYAISCERCPHCGGKIELQTIERYDDMNYKGISKYVCNNCGFSTK